MAAFDNLAAGEHLFDEITYTVTDPSGLSDTAVAQIWVQSRINLAPTAAPTSITISEDGEIDEGTFESLLVGATDVDRLPADAALSMVQETVTSSTGATVIIAADGTFVYDASGSPGIQSLGPGETTSDSFLIRVTDGFDVSATEWVTLLVTGVNDAPTAVDDFYAGVSADGLLTTTTANGLLANDSDIDSPPPLLIDPSQTDLFSAGGALVTLRPDGTFDYDPSGAFAELAEGETAIDTFQYVVLDERGAESIATVRIEVIGVDDAPIAGTDGVERGFWTVATQKIEVPASNGVLANDTDPDAASNGTILEASFDGFSQYGARVIVYPDGSFSYDPTVSATIAQLQADGIDVVDTFTYTVREVAPPAPSGDPPPPAVPAADGEDPGDGPGNALAGPPPQASSEGVVEVILRARPSNYSFDLVVDNLGEIGSGVSINNKGNVAFQTTNGGSDFLYIWSEDTGALSLVPESFVGGGNQVSQPPNNGTGGVPTALFSHIVQINDQDRIFAQRQMNAAAMLGMPIMGIPILTFTDVLLTYAELWNGERVLGGDRYGTPTQIGVGDLGIANAGLRWGNPMMIDLQLVTILGGLLPGVVGFAISASFQLVPRIWTLNPVWSSTYYTPVNPVWNVFQDPDNFNFDVLNAVSLATSLAPIWVPQLYVTPFVAIYPHSASVNNAGQSIFVASTNSSAGDPGLNLVTYGHQGRQPYKSVGIDRPISYAMMADTGHSVYTTQGGDVTIVDFDLNETSSNEFTAYGDRAAISDSGYAAVAGDGPMGEGVYVINARDGKWAKVVGISGDGTLDANEVEIDGEDVGSIQAILGGPVGINGPKVGDEPGTPFFTISFMAMADGKESLHAVNFFPGELENDTLFRPLFIGLNRVVTLGESLPGIGRIDEVRGFDIINNSGQIVFTDGKKVVRANPPINATGDLIYAFERRPISENEVFQRDAGAAVARFIAGDPTATAGQFTATIDFGDGTTGEGTIVPMDDLPLAFEVVAEHEYDREGPYAITVQITDNKNRTGGVAVSLANIVNTVNEEDIEKLVLVDDDGNDTTPTIQSFASPLRPEGDQGGGQSCRVEPPSDEEIRSAGLSTRATFDRSSGTFDVVSVGYGGFVYSYGLATAGSDGQGEPNASQSGGGSSINIRKVLASGRLDPISFAASSFLVDRYETAFDGSSEGVSCFNTSTISERSETEVRSTSQFVDEKTFDDGVIDWVLTTDKTSESFTRGERFVDGDLQSQIDSLIGGSGSALVGEFTVRGTDNSHEVLRESGPVHSITREYTIDTESSVDHRGGRQTFSFVHRTDTMSSFRSVGMVSREDYDITITRDSQTTILEQRQRTGPRDINTTGTSQFNSTTFKSGSVVGSFFIETTSTSSSDTTTTETNQTLTKNSTATANSSSLMEGSGNAEAGNFSFYTSSLSESMIDSNTDNQQQSSQSSQQSATRVNVSQRGNFYEGDYTNQETRHTDYSSNSRTENQTSVVTSESTGRQDLTAYATGNKKSGDFSIRERSTSSDTTETTQTNQSETKTSESTTETSGESNKAGNAKAGDFEFDGFSYANVVTVKATTNGPLRTETDETVESETRYEGSGSSRSGNVRKTENATTETESQRRLVNQTQFSTTDTKSKRTDRVGTDSNTVTGDYTRTVEGTTQGTQRTTSDNQDQSIVTTVRTDSSDRSTTQGNAISTDKSTSSRSTSSETRDVRDSIVTPTLLSQTDFTHSESSTVAVANESSNSIVGNFSSLQVIDVDSQSRHTQHNQTSTKLVTSEMTSHQELDSTGNLISGASVSSDTSFSTTETISGSSNGPLIIPRAPFATENPIRPERINGDSTIQVDSVVNATSNSITGIFNSVSDSTVTRNSNSRRENISSYTETASRSTEVTHSESDGNQITGDVVITTLEETESDHGSNHSNQTLTDQEFGTSETTRRSTEDGNRFTGDFTVLSNFYSDGATLVTRTNQTLTETRRTGTTADGRGTEFVNRVTGDSTSQENTWVGARIEVSATNQDQTNTSLTTSDSTTQINRTSNRFTQDYSELRSGESEIIVAQTSVNGSRTVQTNETTDATSSSLSNGNRVTGYFEGNEVIQHTVSGTTLVTHQTYREEGASTSTRRTETERSGNSVTGHYMDSWTTIGGSDSSQTITNQSLTNLVTVQTTGTSSGTSSGNNLSGEVVRSEGGASEVTRVETVTNGSLTSATTSVNVATSQSNSAGNLIIGVVDTESMSDETVTHTEVSTNGTQTTEVSVTDHSTNETMRHEQRVLGDTHYVSRSIVQSDRSTEMTNNGLRSVNETGSESERLIEYDGNSITGIFTREEQTETESAATETETNRGRSESFTATGSQTTHVTAMGNSILGTSSGRNQIEDESTVVHAISNQSLSVAATVDESSTRIQDFMSNSISGESSSTTENSGTRTRVETVVNGTLNASVSESSTFSSTATRTNNTITGDFTDTNSGEQSSRMDGSDTNKSLSVSYVTTVDTTFQSGSGGNAVTGAYTKASTSESTEVRTSTDTNGPLTIDAVTTTVTNIIESGSGDSVAGSSATNVVTMTDVTIDQTDTNQSLTVNIDATSNSRVEVDSTHNEFSGLVTDETTSQSSGVRTEVASNQGYGSTVVTEYSSQSMSSTTGNDITGAMVSTSSGTSLDETISQSTVQTETAGETITLNASFSSESSSNVITGQFASDSQSDSETIVIATVDNQTLDADSTSTTTSATTSSESGNSITGDYSSDVTTISAGSGTQRDVNQVWVINAVFSNDSESQTLETGNRIDGTYAATVTTAETSSHSESNLVNPNSTSASTDNSTSTVTSSGDHVTGAYSSTTIKDSATTFNETYAYLDLSGTRTSSTSSNTMSTSDGNVLMGSDDTTARTESSTAGTSTETNQGIVTVDTTFTNSLVSNTESGSNRLTGQYSSVTTDVSSYSSSETSSNQSLSLAVTDSGNSNVTTTRSGNSVVGAFAEVVDSSASRSGTETTTNQTLTSVIEVTSSSTSQSTTTGNDYSGDSAFTSSGSSLTTKAQTDTNQTQTIELAETTTSTSTGSGSENAITGAFTSAGESSQSTTSDETQSNQTLAGTMHREATTTITDTASGNRIVGDYTTQSIMESSATVSATTTNQTFTVMTTQVESDTSTSTETGNSRFDTYETTFTSTSTVTTNQSKTNQTLTETAATTSTTESSGSRSGNRTSGEYTDDVTKDVTTNGTGSATNQSESSTSETGETLQEVISQIGNDITGMFTSTSTTTSAATQDLAESNTDRSVIGAASYNASVTRETTGNSVTGAFAETTTTIDTSSTNQSGTIGDRSFTLTETTSMTGTSTSTGNRISSEVTVVSSSTDEYDYTKNTTYADGSDTKTAIRSGSNEASSTSNAITGIYSLTSTASQSTSLNESGTRTESYSATSTSESTSTTTDSGNSIVGSFDRSSDADFSSAVTRTLTDAAGTVLSIDETSSEESTDIHTGNEITGLWSSTGASQSSLVTTQSVVTVDGLHDHTVVNSVSSDTSSTGSGNSVTGEVAGQVDSTTITTLSQDGLVGGVTIDFDSTSTEVAQTDTTGNRITGSFQHVTTATDTYSFTQLVDRGADGESTLNGSGVKSYSRSVDADALTGDATSTTTGTDTYTLNQSGTNSSGVFSVELDGEDAFTETETSNSQTGVFNRQSDVAGSVTGSRTIGSVTTAFTEAIDQVVTQNGNYIDGDIDISFAGNGRYDSLVDFVETSNAAAGTPGMLDHSPTGVPMFMGAPPALPTAGGAEALTAVAAAAVSSWTVATTGSLAGAAFRGVQAVAMESIPAGSSLSGSAVMQQYTLAGADAIEQYCFPAGTEVLLADGTAKRIEQIAAGDRVASATFDEDVVALEQRAGQWMHATHTATAALDQPLLRPTKQTTGGTVSQTYHNAPQPLIDIHLGDSKITTTAGHPFFVLNAEDECDHHATPPAISLAHRGTWKLARDLMPGDPLVTADGIALTITAITPNESPAQPVYNFCVAEHHNYHVRLPGTDHFVLVHNDSFGLYTYGNALIPVLIEELNDWAADVANRTQEMIQWVKDNTLIDEVLVGLSNALTDAINVRVIQVGAIVSVFDAETGKAIMDAGREGMRDNTLFGVKSTTVAMAGLSAVATVATFGSVGVIIVSAGAVYGVLDVTTRADLSGKSVQFNEAFRGAINGISNPFGAAFGYVMGSNAVANSNAGSRAELLAEYDYNNRIGTAIGSIFGGLAVTGHAAFMRSGSITYAMKAMSPGVLGAVGGMAYGHLTGQDLARTMEIAATASFAADFVGGLFIKCFVAETPVWVPADGLTESFYAEQPTTVGPGAFDGRITQIGAGVSLAILASMSFAALMRSSPGRNEEQDEQERRRSSVDSVFGSADEDWKDLADVLWGDPLLPHRRKPTFRFS
ncbi:hypothetical protein [Stieleria sp.]|uniref:hypothetical protein n=1 Tax=Stieleria sp. TaxID=2795976 RepID=UPI0035667F53